MWHRTRAFAEPLLYPDISGSYIVKISVYSEVLRFLGRWPVFMIVMYRGSANYFLLVHNPFVFANVYSELTEWMLILFLGGKVALIDQIILYEGNVLCDFFFLIFFIIVIQCF